MNLRAFKKKKEAIKTRHLDASPERPSAYCFASAYRMHYLSENNPTERRTKGYLRWDARQHPAMDDHINLD